MFFVKFIVGFNQVVEPDLQPKINNNSHLEFADLHFAEQNN